MLAKPVVYLILIVASAIALSFGCSDSDSDARGGPTVEVVGDEIIIPQAALAPLSDGYAFSSDLDIDGLEQDLRVRFDGVQVDASTQGEAVVEGSYGVVTGEEQAAEMQIVVVGERSWWRLDDEDWEIGNEPGGDSVHPSLTLAHYATPWFYLDALRFDSLTLPMQGSAEDVNGATAHPVRLDKQAVVDVLQQGTEYKRYPDVWDEHAPLFPGLSENTEQVLPADFLVDVWFAEQGGYPLRIAFTYSVGEDDFCNLCWGFDRGVTVSLQMDITDPDAEVDIEPPIPIPTETNLKPPPGATIPSLTADDEARILDIVQGDSFLNEVLSDRDYTVAQMGVWHNARLTKLGGTLQIVVDEPFTFEGDWPSVAWDESTDSPTFTSAHYRAERISTLHVLVYLLEERVVEVDPLDAEISDYTPALP